MSDNDYSSDYSDSAFWDKVKTYAKKAGENVLEPALILYYTLTDPETPAAAKATIVAALGYFISPIDVIPDITPFLGFSDDLGILAATVAALAAYIKAEHKEKAKEKLGEWFD